MRKINYLIALAIATGVTLSIYPKIKLDLQWVTEDELSPSLPPSVEKLVRQQDSVSDASLSGLKKVTFGDEVKKPSPKRRPAIPSQGAAKPAAQKKPYDDLIEGVVPTARENLMPERSVTTDETTSDQLADTKKDDRWLAGISGPQLSLHQRSTHDNEQACLVDEPDCRQTHDKALSVVGVVVATDRAIRGVADVVEGKFRVGNAKDTPALYLQ